MNSPVLEIKNLHISYGSTRALNGLEFSIPSGSVCAFVGSNGAGKTTTFSAVAGFIRPGSGEIRILGMPLKEYRRKGGLIGLLPQEVSFFEDRTVYSQLLFMAKLSGLDSSAAEKEVESVLAVSGLSDKAHSYPSVLSRGMKVRLGIAQAVLGSPPLILLDEPTAGLDPLRRVQFYEMITLMSGKTTFLISSHQLSELEKLCDRVYMIEEGRLVSSGTMEEMLSGENTVYYKLTARKFPADEISSAFPGYSFSFEPVSMTLSVSYSGIQTDIAELNSGILSWILNKKIGILEVCRKSTLNDRYIRELERGAAANVKSQYQ